jgi:putative ABC transport system ATP-binding protein
VNSQAPLLRAQNLFKSYGEKESKILILNGVSLEVGASQTVSIMGRSGCGKSTLISILAGLDEPDQSPSQGFVEILGQNLARLSGSQLNSFRARHIGIIFQQFHILDHLTALENIRLPLDLNQIKDPENRALHLLNKVGLEHRAHHYPTQLSRGECQRVAIARVLVMRPKILLADEPTGSLDSKTGQAIMDLIFELVTQEKIALIMATHDPSVAERCSTQYKMSEGRI